MCIIVAGKLNCCGCAWFCRKVGGVQKGEPLKLRTSSFTLFFSFLFTNQLFANRYFAMHVYIFKKHLHENMKKEIPFVELVSDLRGFCVTFLYTCFE